MRRVVSRFRLLSSVYADLGNAVFRTGMAPVKAWSRIYLAFELQHYTTLSAGLNDYSQDCCGKIAPGFEWDYGLISCNISAFWFEQSTRDMGLGLGEVPGSRRCLATFKWISHHGKCYLNPQQRMEQNTTRIGGEERSKMITKDSLSPR